MQAAAARRERERTEEETARPRRQTSERGRSGSVPHPRHTGGQRRRCGARGDEGRNGAPRSREGGGRVRARGRLRAAAAKSAAEAALESERQRAANAAQARELEEMRTAMTKLQAEKVEAELLQAEFAAAAPAGRRYRRGQTLTERRNFRARHRTNRHQPMGPSPHFDPRLVNRALAPTVRGIKPRPCSVRIGWHFYINMYIYGYQHVSSSNFFDQWLIPYSIPNYTEPLCHHPSERERGRENERDVETCIGCSSAAKSPRRRWARGSRYPGKASRCPTRES